ncbi:hypothetical protein KIL84_017707 [Mauremys mutica]|uniref:Uncharacterized protein n=1 Tax=Mauremys mutica TaxID=74926 RepID=A0A9D3X6Q2_9SAUR|nr:hypothetical protein KIL84_017707 [Mauremys mutica]
MYHSEGDINLNPVHCLPFLKIPLNFILLRLPTKADELKYKYHKKVAFAVCLARTEAKESEIPSDFLFEQDFRPIFADSRID